MAAKLKLVTEDPKATTRCARFKKALPKKPTKDQLELVGAAAVAGTAIIASFVLGAITVNALYQAEFKRIIAEGEATRTDTPE